MFVETERADDIALDTLLVGTQPVPHSSSDETTEFRLEAARLMLEQGRLPVEGIAVAAGFGDRERMRRSFLRTFGQTPRAIRNASSPLASI
jgi:transcriptional regulator GlxA family with amidase domain